MKKGYIEFKLNNDEKIQLTLNFYCLKWLKMKDKNEEIYKRYNRIVTKGAEDELDNVFILYVGYLCNNIIDNELADLMSEMEFLEKLPCDRMYVNDKIMELIGNKKK